VILNLEKTTISFLEEKMVRHIVSKDGVIIDPKKFDKISKLPFPITKKAFQGFWGMVGFIKNSYTCL
jgi:hypothetical protein